MVLISYCIHMLKVLVLNKNRVNIQPEIFSYNYQQNNIKWAYLINKCRGEYLNLTKVSKRKSK